MNCLFLEYSLEYFQTVVEPVGNKTVDNRGLLYAVSHALSPQGQFRERGRAFLHQDPSRQRGPASSPPPLPQLLFKVIRKVTQFSVRTLTSQAARTPHQAPGIAPCRHSLPDSEIAQPEPPLLPAPPPRGLGATFPPPPPLCLSGPAALTAAPAAPP